MMIWILVLERVRGGYRCRMSGLSAIAIASVGVVPPLSSFSMTLLHCPAYYFGGGVLTAYLYLGFKVLADNQPTNLLHKIIRYPISVIIAASYPLFT
jgi:hypothetical protein